MTSEHIKGHLAVISAYTIMGLNIVVSKSLLSAWMSPMGLTVTLLAFSCAVFWIISLFSHKEKVSRRDLLIIFAGGLFGLVISKITFSFGIRFTSSVTWSLIANLIPIIVLLLSALLLKEPISPKKVIGVIIGISGAMLIVLRNRSEGSSPHNALGVSLAFLSIISYGSHIIIIRKISLKYTSITIMKWMFLFAVAALIPFGIRELPRQRIFSPEITLIPTLQLCYTLVLAGLLASFLMPVALKRIKATTVSMYINLQPIVAFGAAFIVGQDTFSIDKPLALILIIIGIYIVTQEKSKKETGVDQHE